MVKLIVLTLLLAGLLMTETEAQQSKQRPLAKGTCVVIGELVESAGSRFERYRGKAVAPNVYEATIWISGFRSCSVVLTDLSMYVCTRPTNSEAEARALYDLALGKTRACVSDWSEAPPYDADAQGLSMIQGRRFVETVDGGEIAIGIGHARDARGAQPEDSVSIVVTMRKQAPLAS